MATIPPTSSSNSTGSVATVVRAGVATSTGNFIVNLVNLGRDVAIALAFGTAITVDAFFLALMVPVFMATVAIGAYRNTVVPILERIIHENGKDGVAGLISRLMIGNLRIVFAAGAGLALLAPFYAPLLAGRLPLEAATLIKTLSWAVLPMALISAYASLAEGPLQTLGMYFWPTVFRAAVPLGVALGAILWGSTCGIWGACYGGALGSVVHLALTYLLLPKRTHTSDEWASYDPAISREIRQQFGFLSASVAIAYISPLIDQWMASFLETGAVSVLSYANRLVVGVASVATSALSPTLLPHFSRLAARGETHRFHPHYIAILRMAWWGGIALAGVMWLIAEPAVALLYEHGNFIRADSFAVSHMVGWLCIQFPPMLAGVVGSTLLSASGHNRVFLPLAILIAIVNAGGNLVLMPYYGLSGIALSTIVTYLVSLVVINIVLVRKGIIRIHRSLLRDLTISLTTAGVIGTFLIITNGKLSVIPTLEQFLLCTVAACVYCAIAYVCMKKVFSTIRKAV